jgi:hypothetical protein
MTTTGYQTLEDRDNVDYFIEWGPKLCNRRNAWLGEGYYFWDGDISLAHDWGRIIYKNKYMIFEGQIVIDENTYDLFGNVAHKMEFYKIYQTLTKSGFLKPGQTITVSKIIEYLKRYIGFKYNSIRAGDYPGRTAIILYGGQQKEFMYANERVQICLITKKNLSLSSFRVIYPEEYVD